jgi:hypothetical protein
VVDGDASYPCPLATHMSYSDMKSSIEGLLSLTPARVAAHDEATLKAGGIEGGEDDAPASRKPSTLCVGEAGSNVNDIETKAEMFRY